MTTIIKHSPIYNAEDGTLRSGAFTLSNGVTGGYLTAKDGEISLYAEKRGGGFIPEANGYYRTDDPVTAIERLATHVLGTVITNGGTQRLIDRSNRLGNAALKGGIDEALKLAKSYAIHGCEFVGFHATAEYETCVDHENGLVSVITLHYRDGKKRTRFATQWQDNVGRDRAEGIINGDAA